MGRRKTTKKASTSARGRKKKETIGLDFIGGILIAIGVILLVILGFENTSSFALVLAEITGGLLGILKIGIPIVFIIVGIECIVLDKAIYPVSEVIKGIVLLCLLSGAVYSFAYDRVFTASDATGFVKWAWIGGITGENIAGNSTNSGAVNVWMNSSGHKANILNSSFNYTGIGVVSSPKYGKIYVQMFIGK